MTHSSRKQYAFELAETPHYYAADFMVSACNEAAFWSVYRWPDWSLPYLILSGPEASGKTHLAHIWAERSAAGFLDARTLDTTKVGELVSSGEASQSWVLERVEQCTDEAALFHLLNAVREQGGHLLMTASQAAAQWNVSLPDLSSRLLAAPAAQLATPDEKVLKATLMKQFSDRQLRVSEEVLDYLLTRMERSYRAAREWVKRLDDAALAEQRKISIPLVRRLLEEESQGDELPGLVENGKG